MRYLIDGYNLLYALGLVRTQGGRAAWDRARKQLLDWVAEQHGKTANQVTLALDAQNEVGHRLVRETHRDLKVLRFAGKLADDLIDQLLQEESDPGTLTVVSNDRRVQAAAIVAGCPVLGCEAYIDLSLREKPRTKSLPVGDEKDVQATSEETAAWIRAFS